MIFLDDHFIGFLLYGLYLFVCLETNICLSHQVKWKLFYHSAFSRSNLIEYQVYWYVPISSTFKLEDPIFERH